MATKSFTNSITERDVSIAIEQLFVAPNGTAAPTGRLDVSSPPAGFIHLGGVVEDSPQLTITRDKYQLNTGIPSVLQFDAVVGLAGQFGMSFYSSSNRIVRYALGGATPRNTISTTTTISTATSRTQLTVAAATGFAVGDVFVTHTTTLITADNEAEVSSIAGTTIHFSGTGFHTLPVAADLIGEVTQVVLAFGTTDLPRYYLVGCADFLDSVQIQHHFPKVSPVGEFSENIQPNQTSIVSANWDLIATDGGAAWNNEFILGHRTTVPKNVV